MNKRQAKKGYMKHGEYKICKKRAKTSWKKLIEECKKQNRFNCIVLGTPGSGKSFKIIIPNCPLDKEVQ